MAEPPSVSEQPATNEHGAEMPQRIGEERVPYRGPARPDAAVRKRRAVLGFVAAIVLLALLTLVLLLEEPLR
jgi:hypothetical protein